MKKLLFEILAGAFSLGYDESKPDQYDAKSSMWTAITGLVTFNLLTILIFILDYFGFDRSVLQENKILFIGFIGAFGLTTYWWFYIRKGKDSVEDYFLSISKKEQRRCKYIFISYGLVSIILFFVVGSEVYWLYGRV